MIKVYWLDLPWTKLTRRGVDDQQFRHIFRACTVKNNREPQGGKVLLYPLADGVPEEREKKR